MEYNRASWESARALATDWRSQNNCPVTDLRTKKLAALTAPRRRWPPALVFGVRVLLLRYAHHPPRDCCREPKVASLTTTTPEASKAASVVVPSQSKGSCAVIFRAQSTTLCQSIQIRVLRWRTLIWLDLLPGRRSCPPQPLFCFETNRRGHHQWDSLHDSSSW
jgi:hypothetical protein